jgi:hypothetical protein
VFIIATIEKAIMPTTTPAIPQMKADLAAWTFSGAPPAVKNKIPAVTKAITAISPKITQIAVSILFIKSVKLPIEFVGTFTAVPIASAITGKSQTPMEIKAILVFVIFFILIILLIYVFVF